MFSIVRMVVKFLLGYREDSDSYWYSRTEPFNPRLMDRQEQIVNELHQLDWVKRILIQVLGKRERNNRVNSFPALERFYMDRVRVLKKLHRSSLFENINPLELGVFGTLFEDLDRKIEQWPAFSSKMNKLENLLQRILQDRDYYPRYEPRYVFVEDKKLEGLLEQFDKYYISENIPQQSQDALQTPSLPINYGFSKENPLVFLCGDQGRVKFGSTKLAPYRLFCRLLKEYGLPVDVPFLYKITKPYPVKKVIGQLRKKIKGTPLIIINRNRAYGLFLQIDSSN